MLSSTRYGARIRKLFVAAQRAQRRLYECMKCGKTKVKRINFAQWRCKSCEAHFAGGAYAFHTETGNIVLRMLAAGRQ